MDQKVVIMKTHFLVLQVIILVHAARGDGGVAQNATSKRKADQHDVKKVDSSKKIYGGKELKQPPTILTVTEEVWIDLKVSNYYGSGNHFRQRIVIACFGKLLPITTSNFVSLVKGYTKTGLYMSYRGTKVQKIVRDFMIQLGDISSRFSENEKFSGPRFQDEGFELSHSNAGWVGMANFGPNTNGAQFYILLRPARWLDGSHVLFGKIIKGMDALQTLGLEETDEEDRPLRPIILENCGVKGLKAPYILAVSQFKTDGDINTGRD